MGTTLSTLSIFLFMPSLFCLCLVGRDFGVGGDVIEFFIKLIVVGFVDVENLSTVTMVH